MGGVWATVAPFVVEQHMGGHITVYLSHHYLKQEQGRSVQKQLEEMGFEVSNPFDSPHQKELNEIINSGGDFNEEVSCKIVEDDLDAIDKADYVFAIISPSIGTCMEVFYSYYVSGKPVFTWIDHDRPYRHPWLVYCSQYVSKDLSKVLTAIEKWPNLDE